MFKREFLEYLESKNYQLEETPRKTIIVTSKEAEKQYECELKCDEISSQKIQIRPHNAYAYYNYGTPPNLSRHIKEFEQHPEHKAACIDSASGTSRKKRRKSSKRTGRRKKKKGRGKTNKR